MGIGSGKEQKEFRKRNWKEDCVTAQGLHMKIEGRKALDYDLDLFNDNYGYISALDFCNGKLVLCHSKCSKSFIITFTNFSLSVLNCHSLPLFFCSILNDLYLF